MSSKKTKEILPLNFFIVVGTIFFFLFFITTTLSIRQIKNKNFEAKIVKKDQKAEGVGLLKMATPKEAKDQKKEGQEIKGFLLAISPEEIILEACESEKIKGDRILAFALDLKTLFILDNKTKESADDVTGALEDLEIGQMISVRETKEEIGRKAKTVRIFQ